MVSVSIHCGVIHNAMVVWMWNKSAQRSRSYKIGYYRKRTTQSNILRLVILPLDTVSSWKYRGVPTTNRCRYSIDESCYHELFSDSFCTPHFLLSKSWSSNRWWAVVCCIVDDFSLLHSFFCILFLVEWHPLIILHSSVFIHQTLVYHSIVDAFAIWTRLLIHLHLLSPSFFFSYSPCLAAQYEDSSSLINRL